MRVALVHDWLTGMRGGEYVLEAIAELFPRATLFTLLKLPGSVSTPLDELECRTSWLQELPGAETRYRHFLPLMPRAVESFDLSGFDLIVSSSHCVAKGIRKPKGSVHVSYVHAPMRYVWDRFDDYFGPRKASPLVRAAARSVRPYLQQWDRRVSSEKRVDVLVANSHFIAEQIQKAYGRSAKVVHPFVDVHRFKRRRKPGDAYLMVGAFAPNKRVDLAIEAFNQLGLPLKIVGKGQDERRIRQLAGPTIELLGPRSNEEIAQLYAESKAFIFPGVEDFGITPLEAMASGLPVVAYGKAGVLETVIDGKTGVFFSQQTCDGLKEAVRKVEEGKVSFDEQRLRRRAAEFSKERFQAGLMNMVDEAFSAATSRREVPRRRPATQVLQLD